MEITSHFIENADLGELHVVRFKPEVVKTTYGAIVPNSLGGNILTPDGFGLPFALASEGTDTLYVEFPGSAHSTLPEDKAIRKDYVKHGAVALGDAVHHCLVGASETKDFSFEELLVGGFSLAAIRAAVLIPAFGSNVKTFFSADAAGYGNHPTFKNMQRYRTHVGQSKQQMAKSGETVEGFYANDVPVFYSFIDTYADVLAEHKVNLATKTFELRAIYDSMTGLISHKIGKQMYIAATNGREFTLRAGFVSNTYALDMEAVNQTNAMLDEVEAIVQETHAPVAAGFVQGGYIGRWHDQAVAPKRIEKLIHDPIKTMQSRLTHTYMS
jgi:hypothetical protein